MTNTVITSPVNGFVARRAADPGAFVSQNAPVVDVVDISRVRLVVNVVEKDLKIVGVGDATDVEVDAFPGEKFTGRIARVSPVLDPATRTFPIEIEIPNPTFRLKPGHVCAGRHHHGRECRRARRADQRRGGRGGGGAACSSRRPTTPRSSDPSRSASRTTNSSEILGGLSEGDRVVTTGAAGLRDGERFLLQGEAQGVAGAGGQLARAARWPLGAGEGVRDLAAAAVAAGREASRARSVSFTYDFRRVSI